jgi:hypothetical protein
MASQQLVTQEQINSLAGDLARAAGITQTQALKVLDVMHVGKLNENLVAHQAIMSDEKMLNALGISHGAAKESLGLSSAINLENLRVAIKPMGKAGMSV